MEPHTFALRLNASGDHAGAMRETKEPGTSEGQHGSGSSPGQSAGNHSRTTTAANI
jgi:hypothetical protein